MEVCRRDYLIKLVSGRILRRNRIYIRRRFSSTSLDTTPHAPATAPQPRYNLRDRNTVQPPRRLIHEQV